jgi:hypothetical protein
MNFSGKLVQIGTSYDKLPTDLTWLTLLEYALNAVNQGVTALGIKGES